MFHKWIRYLVTKSTLNLVPSFLHTFLHSSEMATSPLTSLLPFTNSSTKSNSKLSHFRAFRVSASVSVPETHFQNTPRREFLKGIALSLPLIALTDPPQSQARDVAVGSFLPPSSSDPSFVLFKASPKDTPALRAGTFIFQFKTSDFFENYYMC
jgi:hypothetical protein